MKKLSGNYKTIFLLIIFILSLCIPYIGVVNAQGIADLEQQIEQKQKELSSKKSILETVESRIKGIKDSNASLQEKIRLMTEELNKAKANSDSKAKEIEKKLLELEQKQKELEEVRGSMDSISGLLYVESRNRFANFVFSDWKDLVQSFYVRKGALNILKDRVEEISGEFSNLVEAKEGLDKEKEVLDKQKEELDKSYALLDKERAKLQAELNRHYSQKKKLSADITDLSKNVSQLQAALIAARSAGTVSSGGSTGSSLGTSISQAPAGSFGVFSIGAYTHRNGMSQWGAKARSEAGQTSAQILSVYYPNSKVSKGTVNVGFGVEPLLTNISVDGYGSLSFEDYYLMGIKEMPESWNLEALKAQAIAARTFAVRYTQNGRKNICTTQSCQVFSTPLKTGAWKTAVQQTRGQILVDNSGAPILTQYAAVHGGWVNNVGWDTKSNGGSNWFNDAWERISGVSWFYKSWYRAGYSPDPQGENCGHSPFLTGNEMALLLNAYLIKSGKGLKPGARPDKSRLLPSDYGQCSGRLDYGRTDKKPYSLAEMQSLLSSPVSAVYSVSTTLQNGSTTNVTFSTNRGAISMSGFAFKDIYNQMAPGHMRIQQQSSYAYFNVEKK